jgi:hypothetical protein
MIGRNEVPYLTQKSDLDGPGGRGCVRAGVRMCLCQGKIEAEAEVDEVEEGKRRRIT